MTEPNATHRAENGIIKLLLEMGPLVLFFAANSKPEWFKPIVGALFGQGVVASEKAPILIATAVFMVGMAASLIATWALYRRLPIMPLVSGAVVLVFGGLTLALHNDLFIKLKPTIVNSLFGAVLLGGLAFGKPLLPYVLDSVFQLDAEGWKKLTFRWGVFFFVLAAINEVVWRTQPRISGGLQGLGCDAAHHGFRIGADTDDDAPRISTGK